MATLFAICEYAAGDNYRRLRNSAGVSATELAQNFGMSRTQTMQLLRDAV